MLFIDIHQSFFFVVPLEKQKRDELSKQDGKRKSRDIRCCKQTAYVLFGKSVLASTIKIEDAEKSTDSIISSQYHMHAHQAIRPKRPLPFLHITSNMKRSERVK